MAINSSGFALVAGMAATVILFGSTLLSAAGLLGVAAPDDGEPAVCGVVSEPARPDTLTPWCGNAALEVAQLHSLTPAARDTIAAGDALFKGNCAQCHAVNDKVVGPALAGITKRRPIAWLISWVQNSSKVVASGDAYAVKLFNKYDKQQMPSFALSDKEIAAIMAYVELQAYATAAAGEQPVVED